MSDAAVDMGLWGLLVVSLVASCLLILGAMAMIARKQTNLDYQRAAGINGTHLLQGHIDTRIYGAFLLAGITFAVFSSLLLADASMIWRQWVNRSLFVALPLLSSIVIILNWLDERRQMHIEIENDRRDKVIAKTLATVAEQQRTAILQADRDSYKEMAAEAIASLAIVANRYRIEGGHDVTSPLAAVVPEHQSPVTPEQQATADLQTMRAQLTASTLDLGLPTRTAASADEEAPPPQSVDIASIQPAAAQAIADAQHSLKEGV